MKRGFRFTLQSMAVASLLAGAFVGTAASAQPQGGPPPGPGFGGPPPGGFGGPRGRGPRQASVANIPVEALTAGLKLTADQKTKIASIQKQLQQQRESLMDRRGEQPGNPPDPETMRANMEKLRSQEQTAVQNIEAALTAAQKQALPAFLKELDSLREVGIPIEVYGSLNLTADQKAKIAAIAQKAQQEMRQKMEAARESGDFGAVREAMEQSRQQTHEKAMAALTEAQRSAIEKYIAAHPRPERGPGFGPGGPGGPGGPPPGGFGGPPPGDGPPPPPPAL